ncbi:MAG: MFS transporter [Pseudobdellovibrionaceae bacterium]
MKIIKEIKSVLNLTVIVAGLGYFVDLFDIALFGVVRVSSLKALGLSDPNELLSAGLHIYNMQMLGMMLGGLLWGIIADKKGRLSVMFASILLYSLGNIANAFVTNIEAYAICRFITGFGLAGELGAAITLVAESLPIKSRGLGTTVVATLGLLGSVTASWVGQHLDWKTAYIVGGVLGLLLLLTRFKMFESNMFDKSSADSVVKGDLRLLFKSKRWLRYLYCIALGVPIYFVTGILFTFSPELAKGLGVQGDVVAGQAIFYGSIGLTLGDFMSGLLSQHLQSRKKAVAVSLLIALLAMFVYLLRPNSSPSEIYILCFVLGLAAGYWAVLVTMAAEQFGTNIRGTVATTVPNFVRGSAVITISIFTYLKSYMSLQSAAIVVGLGCFILAFAALYKMEETFNKDLDYTEV